MKVIIHDLSDEIFSSMQIDTGESAVISALNNAAQCRGCFGCWLRTPGQCIMKDSLQNTGAQICTAETLIIISRCVFGGFSPEIKKIIDRSIPGILPFFTRRNGEMHHICRYKTHVDLRVFFYGECTEEECDLAESIVAANGVNFFSVSTCKVEFAPIEKIKENLI